MRRYHYILSQSIQLCGHNQEMECRRNWMVSTLLRVREAVPSNILVQDIALTHFSKFIPLNPILSDGASYKFG
jgi:hypothetical protein